MAVFLLVLNKSITVVQLGDFPAKNSLEAFSNLEVALTSRHLKNKGMEPEEFVTIISR